MQAQNSLETARIKYKNCIRIEPKKVSTGDIIVEEEFIDKKFIVAEVNKGYIEAYETKGVQLIVKDVDTGEHHTWFEADNADHYNFQLRLFKVGEAWSKMTSLQGFLWAAFVIGLIVWLISQ